MSNSNIYIASSQQKRSQQITSKLSKPLICLNKQYTKAYCCERLDHRTCKFYVDLSVRLLSDVGLAYIILLIFDVNKKA